MVLLDPLRKRIASWRRELEAPTAALDLLIRIQDWVGEMGLLREPRLDDFGNDGLHRCAQPVAARATADMLQC